MNSWRSQAATLGALAALCTPLSAVEGQYRDSLRVGLAYVRPARQDPPEPASFAELAGTGVAYSGAFALAGLLMGQYVDAYTCSRRHHGEPVGFLGPCSFYVGAGTAAGWLGGAVWGATLGASSVATEAGCPHGAAIRRSLAGATLGALPGLILVADHPERYPSEKSVLIVGTPVLSALGATVAVIGCRPRRPALSRRNVPLDSAVPPAHPDSGARRMTMPQAGDTAPDFTAPTDSGEALTLSSLRGKPVVLFFYPADDTPGCTVESCSFRDNLPRFQGTDAVILGVSPDDVESHRRFREKFALPYALVSDEGHRIADAYGVWGERSIFGLKFAGNRRTTFVVGRDGRVARVFEKVKPQGHAEEVAEAVRSLGG